MMQKFFKITWYEKTKYNPIERTNAVVVNTDTDDIGVNSKAALNLFIKGFGSLTRNEIVKIIEIDEEGNQIGEDITPVEDSAIVPTV